MFVKVIQDFLKTDDPYWNGVLHCALLLVPVLAVVWRVASANRVAQALKSMPTNEPLIPTTKDYKPGSSDTPGILALMLELEVVVVCTNEIKKLNKKIEDVQKSSIETKAATVAVVDRLLKVERILEQKLSILSDVLSKAAEVLLQSKEERLDKTKKAAADQKAAKEGKNGKKDK